MHFWHFLSNIVCDRAGSETLFYKYPSSSSKRANSTGNCTEKFLPCPPPFCQPNTELNHPCFARWVSWQLQEMKINCVKSSTSTVGCVFPLLVLFPPWACTAGRAVGSQLGFGFLLTVFFAWSISVFSSCPLCSLPPESHFLPASEMCFSSLFSTSTFSCSLTFVKPLPLCVVYCLFAKQLESCWTGKWFLLSYSHSLQCVTSLRQFHALDQGISNIVFVSGILLGKKISNSHR